MVSYHSIFSRPLILLLLLKIVFKPFLSYTYIINQKHDKIFIVAQSRTVRHISIYKTSAIF